jgi:C-terminal peptidase prc
MKKYIAILSSLSFVRVWSVFASSGEYATWSTWSVLPQITVTSDTPLMTIVPPAKQKRKAVPRPLTLQKFFVDVCSRLWDWMPVVYKDIDISWPQVKKWTKLYTALQKCAYLWIVEKRWKITNFLVPVKGNFVYDFLWTKLNLTVDVALQPDENVSISTWETYIRHRVPTFIAIQKLLQVASFGANSIYENPIIRSEYFPAFADIFNQLYNNYYYLSWGATDEQLLYGAIQWMVDSLHDKYSIYFPPEQSTDFYWSIQGTYYWVGMYVDVRDWKCVVGATIPWAPASQAWLQAWDVIVSVDGWVVPEVFALTDVTSRIKWPVETNVIIDVKRWNTPLSFSITRKKIVIPMLEVEHTNRTVIFTINSFGQGLTAQFNEAVQVYEKQISSAEKIIIDVRSNPGWYLEEAAGILSFFVEKWLPVVRMDRKNYTEDIVSEGYSTIFNKKQLFLLINWWSASASEILVGTLKDYIPTAKIVGEQSFGKWSAQSIAWLPNWWSVKYTVALWKTWKEKQSIEWVGIKPDIILTDDAKTTDDEVMQKVLSW